MDRIITTSSVCVDSQPGALAVHSKYKMDQVQNCEEGEEGKEG